MPDLVELLVEEGAAEAVAGIREQRVDGTALGRGVQLIDAVLRREIHFQRLDRGAGAAADVGDLGEAGGVRCQQQVVAVARRDDGELTADP